ncbi:AAA family ATPase [Desulfovibrio sp. OttesenSCG-928-I05]|nr:AAA family ATPase [Desulfovibrio sp. OttesenSCG-928-I05]
MTNLTLINMRDVVVQTTEWLWYPYIPFGKLTIMQGDGGDGKTTTALQIISAVTTGSLLPECANAVGPFDVIFQTAEDGLGDTIKPRLLQAQADVSRVHVVDESLEGLTLSDARIEQAILQTGARLIVLDPLQAYLGAKVDMHRANEVRPILKKVGDIAEKYGCAFVVIGHLNKSTNKSQYRGLGSVDIYSASRSVMTFGRVRDQQYTRAFAHTKANLAPEGPSIAYELHPETGFRWLGKCDITAAELLGSDFEGNWRKKETAFDRAVSLLQQELAQEHLPAETIYSKAEKLEISKRTLDSAKAQLAIKSRKIGNQWYWELPRNKEDCNNVTL